MLKKILLLGGLGFIGKNLYIGLRNKGYDVHILSDTPLSGDDIFKNYLKPEDLFTGNISIIKDICEMVCDYTAIYCLAGLSCAADSLNRPLLDNEINCVANLNILEACKKHNPDV